MTSHLKRATKKSASASLAALRESANLCNKPHLLQGVADDEEAFAGQDLLLHGHRVLQELHDEGQQSAAGKKGGVVTNEREERGEERKRFRLD